MGISLKILSRLSEEQLRDLMRKKKVLGKLAELKKKGARLAAELARVEKAVAKLETSLSRSPARPVPRKSGRKPGRGRARAGRRSTGVRAGSRGLPLIVKQVLQTAPAPLAARQILDLVVKKGWKARTKNPLLRVYAALRSIGAKKSKKGYFLK